MSLKSYNMFYDMQEKKMGVKKEKYKKQPIPPELRYQVWDKYIGKETSGLCLCCNTNKIVIMGHRKEVFEAGHIIAESKGGPTTLENLRPVCKKCNGQMTTRNMIELQKERYPKAKPINSLVFPIDDIFGLYNMSNFEVKSQIMDLKKICLPDNPVSYDLKDITNPISLHCGPIEEFVDFVNKPTKKNPDQFKDLIDFHNTLYKK
jgi:5-methylcytosine-specific restriction endonuclease McrA